MPPSLREWLPGGHLAWFVLETVAKVDLGAVYGEYRVDGHGRPAHDPGMMVALLLYAYAVGERSSRQIERRCAEDVALRVIAANRVPDHTTIARFRVRHEQALGDLFCSVLALCAKVGMVKVGTVAVDGTKLAGDAGLGANRGHPAIRKEVEAMLAQAAATDAVEDQQFGAARGDELPGELADPVSRQARLERAAAEIEAEEADRQAARQAAHQAKVAAREEHKAQAVVGEGQVILAAQITNSPNDSNQLAPLVTAARENLDTIGHEPKIKCVLADGAYWNQADIAAIGQTKAVVIVPTSDPHHKGVRKRAPQQGPEADRINKILATAAGRRLYRRRAAIVEPVFAHTKHTRGITRLSRRGIDAATREWQLIATTHNLLKLFRHQPQPA